MGSQEQSLHQGLIMVKPHAVDQVLDPVICGILAGDVAFENYGGGGQPLNDMLARVDAQPPIVRDLAACRYGGYMIDLFYGDKVGRRYFPMIVERYVGKVVFMPYTFTGTPGEFALFRDELKGNTEMFDADGKQVCEPSGIRGALALPYQFFSREASMDLGDEAYRDAFLPVVDNLFHVCDKPSEAEIALQIIGG